MRSMERERSDRAAPLLLVAAISTAASTARKFPRKDCHGALIMADALPREEQNALLRSIVQQVKLPRPKNVRPIIVIGTGGIVRAAHLPAYKKAGFPVIGLMDEIPEKADKLASEQDIKRTFRSVAEATRYATPDTIFDVAVPASQLIRS